MIVERLDRLEDLLCLLADQLPGRIPERIATLVATIRAGRMTNVAAPASRDTPRPILAPLTYSERETLLTLFCDPNEQTSYVLAVRPVVEPWLFARGWSNAAVPTDPMAEYRRGGMQDAVPIDWTPDLPDTINVAHPIHALSYVLPPIHGLCWQEILISMVGTSPEAREILIGYGVLKR